MQDEGIKANFKTFLKDYKEIAELKNFDSKMNLNTFSNAIYRELLNNAVPNTIEETK
jgi:hypothetical protein